MSAFGAAWRPALARLAIAAPGRGLGIVALTEVGAAEMTAATGVGDLALRSAQQRLCIGLAHDILLNGRKTQPKCCRLHPRSKTSGMSGSDDVAGGAFAGTAILDDVEANLLPLIKGRHASLLDG